MEKATQLPDDFLLEIPLESEQKKILIEQINRFNALREKELYPLSLETDEKGRVVLKEGTIIHGISSFNVDVVDKISKTGILTGQAIGIPEDGETFYCADFHRIPKGMSMEEFNKSFTYVDGRCPFGNGRRGANTLAFVIEPREEAVELLKYDCYRDGNEANITKSFTNEAGLLDQSEKLSSILYGVPSNMFNGIVLGNNILENKAVLELLIKMYPDCYISSIDGVVIYNPSMDVSYTEIIRSRAENYVLKFKNKLLKEELNMSQEQTQKLRKKNQEIIDAIINGCSIDLAARILVDNKLIQGTLESVIEYVESRKESFGKSK